VISSAGPAIAPADMPVPARSAARSCGVLPYPRWMSAKYAADIGSASEKFPVSWLNMTTR
jgi:hypothetical protein